jgi:hypothetical protein
MPLPWTEIRDRAIKFSREWQDAGSERAEAQTFWNELLDSRKRPWNQSPASCPPYAPEGLLAAVTENVFNERVAIHT